MDVIVLNKNNKEIERFSGVMIDGVFTYKEGGYGIPFTSIRFFQETKKINIDYIDSMELRTGNTVFVTFDGKDYKQRYSDQKTNIESQSVRNFVRDNQSGELQAKVMLTKPTSLASLAPILILIAIALLVVGIYWGFGNILNQMFATQKPFGQAINQSLLIQRQELNQTHQLIVLYNATLNKLNSK